MPTTHQTACSDSPSTLVAIVRAARLSGDTDLERAARRELLERFGMRVQFDQHQTREAVSQ